MVRRIAERALASPVRNLAGGMVFVFAVAALAVGLYMHAGWSAGDALYMTVLTVFTVGYDEVRPIDTPGLRAITMGLIVCGCTGMIFLTGALVQLITATQFSELLDVRRMNSRIDGLAGHVIVCGYGRIGNMLARKLQAGGAPVLVVEREEARCAEAHAAGHLFIRADATEEAVLARAGIDRARALATVLPNDAANVFITLSARGLNAGLTVIARGEAPSTERKLLLAGANRVVMPAHIGAERMAEMILFPQGEAASRAEPELRRLGLTVETVLAEPGSTFAGLTVREIERLAEGAFLIAEIERAGGRRERPDEAMRVVPGDGLVVIGRSTGAARIGFAAGEDGREHG
jgi:voltage-gated potassium channel